MKIEHIIFLIHPCCYENIAPDALRKDNLYLFVEREDEVKQQWIEALEKRPTHTLFLQLGGPEYLRETAAANLGEAAVFYPRTSFPDNGDLREYYRRLASDFRDYVSTHGLQLDTTAVTSELWGESFEGCVPGYGGAFAEYLGLQCPPQMRFEMTVYDSRFLYGALRWEVIPIDDCDVEAWLFECHDGTGAAIFQARLTAQWVDERCLHLQLDDRRLQICTKNGHTIWPPTPWEKGKPERIDAYSMTLADCNWRWVRAIGMAIDDFRKVISAARVTGCKDGG